MSDDPGGVPTAFKTMKAMARYYRAVTINQLYVLLGGLSQEDAAEMLNGELTPGDPSTLVDDSKFAGKTPEEIIKVLVEEENNGICTDNPGLS